MPTNAQVGYRWLTSEAGWTEGAPRFLEATYVRPKTQTFSSDGRRYGGFIVRVYFDGQLQDQRANPPDLLTLFPTEDHLHVSLPMRPRTVTVATRIQSVCSGRRIACEPQAKRFVATVACAAL